MKNINLYIVIIALLSNSIYSQINNSSELQIKYVVLTVFDIDSAIVNNSVAESVKQTKPLSFFLNVIGNKAVYLEEDTMGDETENRQSLSMRSIISNEGYQSITYDSERKIVEKSKFVLGTTFCVKSKFDDAKWKIAKESKMIDKYLCYKATLMKKTLDRKGELIEKKITAYFSPELPISLGPLGYCGLPGLILELIEDSKIIRIVSVESFNSKQFKFSKLNNCTEVFSSDLALEKFLAEKRND